MTVAAKCNITTLALDKMNSLKWGFSCVVPNYLIAENYIEYLNCPDVKIDDCFTGNCNGEPIVIVHNCELVITQIRVKFPSPASEVLLYETFYVTPEIDIVNGTPPYTYEWSFPTNLFTRLTSSNPAELLLAVRQDISFDPDLMSYPITLTVTDSVGCAYTKTCYKTPTGMECGHRYEECSNVGILTVDTEYLVCSAPDTLTIT